MGEYYILINEGRNWQGKKVATVYVKEGEFFKFQGGHTQEWGKRWFSVYAESIEDARKKGYAIAGVSS